MSPQDSRSSLVIIKEAELLSGSNDFVRNFFVNKASGTERIEIIDIDAEVELNLLEKNNDFIDLTLAQYCLFDSTIEKLFSKAISSNKLSLKLACLSNRSIGRREWSFNKLPGALFSDKAEQIANWFTVITKQELDELFGNETIDNSFLTNLLETDNALWNAFTEDKQIAVLRSLYYNSRVCKNYDGPMDGYAEYLHGKLFSTIWDLTKKVPVTKVWARALGSLLEKTKDDRYDFDSFEIAKRWYVDDEDEEKDGKKLFLNSFESVRCAIYGNVIKDLYGKDKSNQTHFENEDVAYRACAYQRLRMLTVNDIKSVYEKDKLVAIEHLMKNYNIWRKNDLRSALKDICWDADEKYNNSHLDCANMFKWKEEYLTEKYPDWFVESDTSEWVDEDEKVLTYGLARDLINETSYNQSVEFLTSLNEIKNKVNDHISYIKWIFYGVIIIVISMFFKH